MLLITKLIRSNRHLNVLFQCTVLALCRFEGRARMIFCRMEKNGTEPKERKIPKIIHLCWFGEQPYPTIVLRCLHSWYRRLPDYKIMLWNDASHLYGEFPFIEEALKSKKYAFAADVVRVYAVYKYGGIYMDSDIFVRKRFDNYLNHRTVLFREYYPERVAFEQSHPDLPSDERWGSEIQAALFAAEKGSPIIGDVLNYYRGRHFINEDESLDMQMVAPQIMARIVEKYGFSYEDIDQILPHDTVVNAYGPVARDTCCDPGDAFAIHLCTQSWK